MFPGRTGLFFALAILLAAAAQVFAGEPIIVGKEKPKANAIKDTRFDKELSRPWENVAPDSALSGLIFPAMPRLEPIDPKADRKRKIQEREKKNWMSVLPGDLQAEEEAKNFLGVREYDLGKEEDSDNLMFRDLQNDREGRDRTQGRSSRSSPRTSAERAAEADELERELAARRAARLEASRAETQHGSHTANALDFKGLLGNAPGESGRSEFSLRNILGGPEQQSRSQQATREEFKAFLNGQPSGPNSAGGLADPINSWRSDFTRQPLNPAIGRAPETRANDALGAQQGFAPASHANPFTPKAFEDSLASRSLIPGLSSPNLTTPAQPPRTLQPPPNRAVGLNSLGGHSR
jgi:hypothetical protein